MDRLDRILLTKAERETLAELDRAIAATKRGLSRERLEQRDQEAIADELRRAGMIVR